MANDNALFDTVGALRDYLAQFPAETPLTVSYDGSGRVSAVESYHGDKLACVAVAPASEVWLAAKGEPLDNPTFEWIEP